MIKVGASKKCINPSKDMYPIPSSFSDFGSEPLLQSDIYDDMFVRTIIIDNGKDRFLICVYETQGYPGVPNIKEILAKAAGCKIDNVLIAGTHNHSSAKDVHGGLENNSPEEVKFHEAYWKIEEKAGLDSVKQALENMKPAKYGYGTGLSYCNVNRDVQTPFGYWVEGKNIAGYSDRNIRCIKFVDYEDKVIAALFNYGMHNTCIHMMKDFDGKAKTSGNVSGIACRFVEEALGDGMVAVWTAGCSGNQNPLMSHGLQYEYPDGYSTSVPFPDGVGFMMMEYNGRLHGVDCLKTLKSIDANKTEMETIKSVRNDAFLPGQKREVAQNKHEMFRMGGNGLRKDGDYPKLPELPKMVDDNDVRCQMELAILGDVGIVSVCGEPYAEIGTKMIEAASLKNTMIVTHTGKDSARYILSKQAKDEKVFQAFRRVKPGSSDEILINNTKKLFELAGIKNPS